ncbi:class I SAM-dependent methyltransferase [Martelella alba]|uniref:Class I SAM-dependent methyltransferase n=2 Tax=Martelella alba TaxID=2590451 RepID=A0ABY2SK60_9HYPH|nr:class I SAM-dependent methyltransferase [Martelella alba]
MEIYERHYRQLRENNQSAWTGEGYERAWSRLSETMQRLDAGDILPAPGGVCLDLGCGNGAMASLYLARAGYEVHGVDISPTAINWARALFFSAGLTAEFREDDVCRLGSYGNHWFDLVFDGSCLHCLIDEQRRQCYQQIKRVLKPQGIFIVSSMCGYPKQSIDRQRYRHETHQLLLNGNPWRTLMPLSLLEQELKDNGFTLFDTAVRENPWWDHATLCCRRA